MILYKYADNKCANKSGIDILRSLRLKVTPPAEFIDPFEFAPRVPDDLSRSGAEQILQNPKVLRGAYDLLKSSGKFTGSFEEFHQPEQDGTLVQKMVQWYPQATANFWRLHREQISKEYGVLCLAEEPDNILMWSHYADGHKGFVVGFNTDYPPFKREPLWKVVYQAERVKMDLTLRPGGPEHLESTKAVIRTKSLGWKYENEWRLVYRLSAADHEQIEGHTCYFFKIPPTAIVRVILGCYCTEETEREVKAALANNSLNHVSLEKARLDDKEFRLTIEPIVGGICHIFEQARLARTK